MAKTASTMLPLGTTAPAFNLLNTVNGETVSLQDVRGSKGLLVMFICNHCPFVVHVQNELVALGRDYLSRGIGVVAISSNDVQTYPQDGPDLMRDLAAKLKFPFAYLYDETQAVARAYDAACTPDFFLFDADLKLAYRGQLDDSRPGNAIPVTGKDLRAALEALATGNSVAPDQKPSLGCNLKWKA